MLGVEANPENGGDKSQELLDELGKEINKTKINDFAPPQKRVKKELDFDDMEEWIEEND